MTQGLAFTDRLRFYIRCAGAIALLNYFLFYRFEFNTLWFLCALLVAVGAPLLYAWFAAIFDRASNAANDRTASPSQSADKFLAAAEDGVFLLPLVFVGINVYTALCAATLYAIFRHRNQARSYTLILGVAYFTMAIWVLPQGLWMVVAAHAVAAIVLNRVFPRWFEADFPENQQPRTTR